MKGCLLKLISGEYIELADGSAIITLNLGMRRIKVHMELKQRFEDYTELEFIEFLNEFFGNPHNLARKERQSHIERLVEHFDKIVKHPEGNGLIFYPSEGRDDSPEGIIEDIKKWRTSQGLPLFKDS